MRLAQIGAQHEIDIINTNSYPGHHVLAPDAVLDCDGDLLILEQYGIRWSSRFHLIKRLSSTLAEPMVRILFQSGVDGLLATDTQKSLGEALLSIRIIQEIEDKANAGETDFTVSLSIYSRDIFFHIPFLIANHLNSQQRFAAAHRWYRFIFDPIATEPIPPGLPADEQLRRQRDRVWRYIEFRRNLDIPRVRDILTDPLAIEVYRKDPFNPACDRPATAKCLPKVHRHEGDRQPARLGDSLFAQFTREAVNETTMLYVMAADILGPRPAEIGECGEGTVEPKTYKKHQASDPRFRNTDRAGNRPVERVRREE
jgi:hypothetical protein